MEELVGVAEIADILGVSRQQGSQMSHRKGFPDPIAELACGPIWTRSSIEAFKKTWNRTPGRPRKYKTNDVS